MLAQSQLHTRLRSHSCLKPRLIWCRWTTDGSNLVAGSFVSSANPNNPIVMSGPVGSPAIGIGRFRALRAAIRLSGPTTTTVTAAGESGLITFATAASNTYEFLLLVDSYV